MRGINTEWLSEQDALRVETLRTLAFRAQRKPMLLDDKPDILKALGYFIPHILPCAQRCHMMEVFAYGDMAITLGLPGLSLTGMLLHLLPTQSAQSWLEHICDGELRTFFAVTEPQKGTDANHMESHIAWEDQTPHLYADKWCVGKAASAACGIVIAKKSPNESGMEAIFLDKRTIQQHDKSNTLLREPMPVTTLQAAQLGCIHIHALALEPEQLLGSSLPPLQINHLLYQTFNLMRPCVGAMAFGIARAIIDHIKVHHQTIYHDQHQVWLRLEQQFRHFHQQHAAIAKQIDRNSHDLSLGSKAKLLGVSTLKTITEHLLYHDREQMVMHDPWLSKWCRDAWGLDFMEGISPIHYQNIFHACQRQHLKHSIRND